MVETLCRADVPNSTVMQLSGHKSIQSLNHYKKPSLEQQKSLSHLLSDYDSAQPSVQVRKDTFAMQELFEDKTVIYRRQHQPIEGTFSYGSFANCTFNINFGGQSSSSASTSQSCRQKRARIMYDSSDED